METESLNHLLIAQNYKLAMKKAVFGILCDALYQWWCCYCAFIMVIYELELELSKFHHVFKLN